MSASGEVAVDGELDQALGSLTVSASANITLGGLTVSASGTVSEPVIIDGALEVTLGTLTLTAAGTVAYAIPRGFITITDDTVNSAEVTDMLQSTVQIQQAQLYTVEVTDG